MGVLHRRLPVPLAVCASTRTEQAAWSAGGRRSMTALLARRRARCDVLVAGDGLDAEAPVDESVGRGVRGSSLPPPACAASLLL